MTCFAKTEEECWRLGGACSTHPRKGLKKLIAEGERRGALEMRERAAQLAFDQTSDVPMPGDWNEACGHIGDSIRALPLTPEGPA